MADAAVPGHTHVVARPSLRACGRRCSVRCGWWGSPLLFALPIGTGAAIYLQEYAPRNWLTKTHPDQHQQPGRRAEHCLRDAGTGDLRPRDGTIHQREPVRRHGFERAHDPLRRADDGRARPAADHHQRAGGDQSGARFAATGGLRRRRDALADGLASRPAERPARAF